MKDALPYAVLDVETTFIRGGELPRTLFWGYCDADGYRKFNRTRDLVKFLSQIKPHIILHHSNFDVLQLLLDGAKITIQRSHNARLIRCRLGEQHLLNSYSVFPLPLSQIFECFGYKKSPLTCEYHHEKPNESESECEARQRDAEKCKRCRLALEKRNIEDCRDGLDSFLRLDEIFSRLVGISPLERGTIAGTSFAAACEIAGERLPKDERFLESYRGGRVEVFNTNEAVCDKFDICSSYPRSILECPATDVLLQVVCETKDYFCPLFDAETHDCLMFPNGKFVSYVFESNWQKYIEPHCRNTSLKVISRETIDFSWLNKIKPLVEKLYALKLHSKERKEKALETACKLLLNSMYGRIGLKGESERARILDYRPDREGTIFQLGKNRFLVFDTVFRETKSNFPFAAFITDNARARLYRAFVGSDAYYGDTDSVFSPTARKYFNKNEKCGKEIGEWSDEGTDRFQANNVKDYFWGDDEVRKGGSGFTQWTLKTLAAGLTPRDVTRERISELRKRIVLPDGTTRPNNIHR